MVNLVLKLQLLEVEVMGKPVTDGAIAYLVMVLCKYDKLIIGIPIRMTAECAFAVSRIYAIIHIGIPECFF